MHYSIRAFLIITSENILKHFCAKTYYVFISQVTRDGDIRDFWGLQYKNNSVTLLIFNMTIGNHE
jgi:hypothetical protein